MPSPSPCRGLGRPLKGVDVLFALCGVARLGVGAVLVCARPQVWDTAGQEQFHSLTATYYRKAGGVMIVYDAHSRASFDNLSHWIAQVDENAEGIVKMIVAAKVEGMVAVSNEEGEAFAMAHDCLFASTSSKLGDGVIPAFKTLSSHVLQQQERREEAREGLWLSAAATAEAGQKQPGAKRGGCC